MQINIEEVVNTSGPRSSGAETIAETQPCTMCKAITKFFCYAVLSFAMLMGILIGWCSTTPIPEGTFFATD